MKDRSKWLAVPLLLLIAGILIAGKSMTGSGTEKSEDYFLTGEEVSCQISVGDVTDGPVVVRMKDLHLTSAEAPALEIVGSAEVKLILEGENTIEVTSRKKEDGKAVIRSEGTLEITGDGTLNVHGTGQDGIRVDGSFSMDSGMVRIHAGDDALRAGKSIEISGGTLFLDAENYLIRCEEEQKLAEGCVFFEKQ